MNFIKFEHKKDFALQKYLACLFWHVVLPLQKCYFQHKKKQSIIVFTLLMLNNNTYQSVHDIVCIEKVSIKGTLK